MKNCFRISRIMLPREGVICYPVPPVDLISQEEEECYAAQKISLLPCILPDRETECFDSRLILMKKSIFAYLRARVFERLNEGVIVVERKVNGGIRKGVIASLDLESLNLRKMPVRFSTKTDEALVKRRALVRRAALMEFPHTVLLFRDKKQKLSRYMQTPREKVYDFDLPLERGNISGYFIPFHDAERLMRDITRAEPFFVVADGNHDLASAKRHWDEVSAPLSEEEKLYHPARFTLVECVNYLQESVSLKPIHRVVSDIETEAFCDYFQRNVNCKREGNVLYPILKGPDDYCKADEVIAKFIKQNYGAVTRTLLSPKAYEDSKDCVFVAFPAIEKADLFSAAKSGKKYPAKMFCLGEREDARYSFEGREITYD